MRTSDSAQLSLLSANALHGACFVHLALAQPLRLCNLPYTYLGGVNAPTPDGTDTMWLGAGNLGSIEPVEESSDLTAKGVKLTLSGLPLDLASTALGEQYQGKGVQIWFAPMNPDATLIGTPLRVFWGRIDTMDIELGTAATITLNAESKLIDWYRPRGGRFNNEDQQRRYPGDRGLEYVATIIDKKVVWGWDG